MCHLALGVCNIVCFCLKVSEMSRRCPRKERVNDRRDGKLALFAVHLLNMCVDIPIENRPEMVCVCLCVYVCVCVRVRACVRVTKHTFSQKFEDTSCPHTPVQVYERTQEPQQARVSEDSFLKRRLRSDARAPV